MCLCGLVWAPVLLLFTMMTCLSAGSQHDSHRLWFQTTEFWAGLLSSVNYLRHGGNGMLPEICPLVGSSRFLLACLIDCPIRWISDSFTSLDLNCQPCPVLVSTQVLPTHRVAHLVTSLAMKAGAPQWILSHCSSWSMVSLSTSKF